ncbi:MAG: polysaccharide deacetylase family protein [Solirubrobacteraceae bacterium]
MLGSDRLVLCYHAVSRDWEAAMSIHPQRLERQLKALLARGYVPATFTDCALRAPGRLTLAVTFDDACGSVLELAAPILASLGVPGTVFAPTAYVGSGEPMSWPELQPWLASGHRSELVPLDWAQLAELRDAGWEIGSHTRTHPHLTALSDADLAMELEGSRSELEHHLGITATSLAYPFGDCDRRVAAAARAAGYGVAGALLPARLGSPRQWLWPRVMICHDDDDRRVARQSHPLMRAVQSSPAWPRIEQGVQLVRRAQGRA